PGQCRAAAQDAAQPQAADPAWPREPGPAGGPLAGVIPPGVAGHVTLTIPEATVTRGAGRPGDLAGIGPVDPDLARDLAAAAARNPRSTWHVTITDQHGHAVAHGCARPVKRRRPGGHDPPAAPWPAVTPAGPAVTPAGPAVTLTPAGPGTWRLIAGPREMLVTIEALPGGECDHRHQAAGHDPGVMLRHLTEVRHATCTGPGCRRPAARCDFEHNTPYDAGGRTCLCNGDPKCRSDHRMKQDPRWNAEQLPGGYVRWTMPSGRQHVTEPTRYPI
ncbi:MAG TPA: hypothetical protein VGS06_05175, partial [Streptosporangiaceae bacterium]|nr:hypothetical protein [Streptosporangiaceae bacterium]